mmetsp:Transcript_24314/g.51845  ORF Transcript_24314/g.51845 Transcript_24314/m.51845 type:complete len:118 (-) Transcript_24314:120-473(-)
MRRRNALGPGERGKLAPTKVRSSCLGARHGRVGDVGSGGYFASCVVLVDQSLSVLAVDFLASLFQIGFSESTVIDASDSCPRRDGFCAFVVEACVNFVVFFSCRLLELGPAPAGVAV